MLVQSDFDLLNKRFQNLQVLNLSMNKISSIEESINLPNLRELSLSDNLIKSIHPFLLSKVPKLQILDLSINQISVIQNL